MKAFRALALASLLFSLTGCNAFTSFSEVKALNEAKPIGSPFTVALSQEYKEFSNQQLHEFFDYPDALHFARKGLAAASGENVMPEPVSDWNLDDGHIQELSAARGRLLIAYDLGARNVEPSLSAKAQSEYDCWIENQEEHWNDRQGDCKSAFLNTMNVLESKLQQPPMAPAPLPRDDLAPIEPLAVRAAAPMAPEDAMYLVFYDWDSTSLTSGASNVLSAVVAEARSNPPSVIKIVGHADTSGPQKYNQRLAFKRANAVRDELVKQGLNQNIMSIESRGENDLLVPTPDNVREPANRRANISFE